MKTKNKLGFGIVLVLAFIASAAFASAQTCPDLTLTADPSPFVLGDASSKIEFEINPPGGNPLITWKNYTSVNLTLSAQLQTQDSLFINLSSSSNVPEQWSINGTAAGNYSVNATVYNNTGLACVIPLNVTVVDPPLNPNLSVQMLDLTNTTANTPQNATVIFNNTGAGSAYNISGLLSGTGVTFVNGTVDVSQVDNGSSLNQSYTFQGDACGETTISLVINNVYNSAGELQDPPPGSIEKTITFTGSSLSIDTNNVTYSNTSVNEGDSVNINFSVQNGGTVNATNAQVVLYYDNNTNNTITTVNVGSLNVNSSKALNWTWSSVPSGNHTIHAKFSGSVECSSGHTQDLAGTINAEGAAAPPAASNDDSPDGSGSGGSTPDSMTLVEADSNGKIKFMIRVGQTIKFKSKDNETHMFKLLTVDGLTAEIRISSNPVEFSIRKGETKTLDITDDQNGDIRVKFDALEGILGNFTITYVEETSTQTDQDQDDDANDDGSGDDEAGAEDEGDGITGAATWKLSGKDYVAGGIILVIVALAAVLIMFIWKKF